MDPADFNLIYHPPHFCFTFCGVGVYFTRLEVAAAKNASEKTEEAACGDKQELSDNNRMGSYGHGLSYYYISQQTPSMQN